MPAASVRSPLPAAIYAQHLRTWQSKHRFAPYVVVDDPGVLPVECIDLLPKLIAFRVPELSLKTVIALELNQGDLLRAFLHGDHVAETVYFFQ